MTTGQRLEEIRRLIARTEAENRKQYRETVDDLIRLIDESAAQTGGNKKSALRDAALNALSAKLF
ncbi:hypothetical protein [Bhargavaea beijingensis]|uniref:Uncharacterized protein n=1 Tax=Bhargavaea beijingensis TaxID=426756 RepID=A0ABX9ZCH1_9BACL|nr:hypothetical protein [Bhargavaea beijingensis]RSK30977.1 hypothetical protein EJA12_09680 [Bhargavaea beijingensis]